MRPLHIFSFGLTQLHNMHAMPHPSLQPFAPWALRPAALGAAGGNSDELNIWKWSAVLSQPANSREKAPASMLLARSPTIHSMCNTDSAPQHRDGVGRNHIRARENPGERPRTERTGRGNKSHKTSREMCHFHRDKFTDLGNRNLHNPSTGACKWYLGSTDRGKRSSIFSFSSHLVALRCVCMVSTHGRVSEWHAAGQPPHNFCYN